MTKQETIKVITLLMFSYPSQDKLKEEETLKGMVAVWSECFKDDDVNVVLKACKKHIISSKWFPSIAEIKALIDKLVTDEYNAKLEILSRGLRIEISSVEHKQIGGKENENETH